MSRVLVIGGGPAGMMAAIAAARNGAEVCLLEKTDRVGKKMRITGKGRCNITNAADMQEIIKNIPGNGAFLHSVFKAFDNQDVIQFFEDASVPTKVERGGRVFPVSDHADDCVNAMLHELHEAGVEVAVKSEVKHIVFHKQKVTGVQLKDGEILEADAVILAAGGASYPKTGSDGSGAELAKEAGHTIIPLLPALIPLESEEEWVAELQGLSLKNVHVDLLVDGEKTADAFGEMMFTHFGVTGPIILTLSRTAAFALHDEKEVELELSLKPALTPEQLQKRVERDFELYQKKSIKNAMHDLLPMRMIPIILDLAFIDPDKPVNQLTRAERFRIVNLLQHLTISISKTRPLDEAIVTCGGVSVKEVNPKTMESKIIKGLYFAGEVLDIDGFTGGYNLQAAFSMGYAAGNWSVWNIDEN